MGIQFIHIDGYARVGSTQTITDKKTKQVKTKKKRSARDIANEAERVEGNTAHIENPKPPNIIFGCKPSEAVDLSEQWAEEAKDAIGRKLRKDGLCLLAGVISISRKDEAGWEDLKGRSVSWLKQTYGNRLKSIVEHQDEANPHLHFYVVPNKNETFAKIHHGFNAVEQVKKEQAEKKKETTEKIAYKQEQNLAYIKAMREFQDKFYLDVGYKSGLTRLGPKIRRVPRNIYKAEQALAQSFKNTHKNLEKIKQDAFKRGYQVKAREVEKEMSTVFHIAKTQLLNIFSRPGKSDEQANEYISRIKQLENELKDTRNELKDTKNKYTALQKAVKNHPEAVEIKKEYLSSKSINTDDLDRFLKDKKRKQELDIELEEKSSIQVELEDLEMYAKQGFKKDNQGHPRKLR